MFSVIKRAVVLKFRLFCKRSTLHGFCYFYKSNSWTTYMIWTTIILSSFILCSLLSSMTWDSYVTDPTFTVVETTHYPMAEIAFPSVAVCDGELVYGPATERITDILVSRGYTNDQIEEFYRSINALKSKDYNDYIAPAFVPEMHKLLEDIGFSISYLVELLKKPCEALMVECVWRSKAHDCSKMFRGVFTVVGYCCQFDVQYFSSQVKNMNISFVSGIEVGQALQVIVNEQTVSSNGTVSSGLVLVYIFDHKDSLTLLDSPVIMTAESYFDIHIEVWAIDSSDNVKALPVDVRKCLLKTDKGEGADFFKGCMSILIIKQVADRCGCLPFNYTAEELKLGIHTPCDWELTLCVARAIEEINLDLYPLVPNSGCYDRCDFVQYATEVRFIKESRKTKSPSDYTGRFSVHFMDSTCMKYRRQVIYTWDQMWANLGGIFGLCLGGSIISIIELFWFIMDLIFSVTKSVVVKRKISPKWKMSQKIFSTNLPAMNYKNSKRRLAFID